MGWVGSGSESLCGSRSGSGCWSGRGEDELRGWGRGSEELELEVWRTWLWMRLAEEGEGL